VLDTQSLVSNSPLSEKLPNGLWITGAAVLEYQLTSKGIRMPINAEEELKIIKVVVGVFNGGLSGATLTEISNLFEGGLTTLQLAIAISSGPTFTEQLMGGKVTVQDQVATMMNNFGFVADGVPDSASSIIENYMTLRIEGGWHFGVIVDEMATVFSMDTLPAMWTPYVNLMSNKALIAKLYIDKNAPDVFETNIALLANTPRASLLTEVEAQAYVDGFVATSIALTSNTDNLTGTSEIDTFSAVFDPDGNASTISNADILDGGLSVDSLNVRIASTSTTENSVAMVSSNIEKFFFTHQEAGSTFTFDFNNINGATEAWDKGSIGTVVTRAINVDPTVTVGMMDTLGFYDVNFSGDRSGAVDAFTLLLNGAGNSTEDASFSTITSSSTADDSFEIANITSTSTLSNVSLGNGSGAMTLNTINVSGDAALQLSGHSNFTSLHTVDASAMSAGGLKIDASGSTEANFKFTGSAFDDLLALQNTTINTTSSLDGGAGKDTLATQNFNNLTASAVNSATGFEVLQGIGGAENFSAADFTGISEFLFSGTTSSGKTITNLENDDKIRLSTDISGGNYGLRMEGKNAGTKANLELISLNETNGETVITSTSNNNPRYGVEIRSNITELTLESTGTGSKANVIETTLDSDSGYAFYNSTTPIFNITGSHDLSIMAKAGTDLSTNKPLYGFSSAVNVDASNFTGVLRIAGSNGEDTLKGGSNADIFYSQGGADTLTGNSGADQFRLYGNNNTVDTITDFIQGTDSIGLNQFNFTNTTASQAGATLALSDYIDNRDGITNIGSADAHKVIELQTSLSSGQIAADTGAAIAAFVLVYNTSSNKAELWYDNDWSTASNRDHVVTFDNIVDLAGVKSFSNLDFVEYSF